jgi:hypothetical protein
MAVAALDLAADKIDLLQLYDILHYKLQLQQLQK